MSATRSVDELRAKIIELAGDDAAEDIAISENYDYADACIGISDDNRAVYDYDKTIDYLVFIEGWSPSDAIEWIEYNTMRAYPPNGMKPPIILHRFLD